MKVAVLMTCFNRREKTLACLRALFASRCSESVRLEVFLVDDASSDGTAAAVIDEFPGVNVIDGSGKLFWNGGMRRAFEQAWGKGADYFLWLNDDTTLYPDAIGRMIALSLERRNTTLMPSIIVGSTRDGQSGELTYGGKRQTSRWLPFRFALIHPGVAPLPCDTFNGNCVLVPEAVAKAVGNLEARFVHAMGDIDYGFRASRSGFGVWVLPGYAGTCTHDHVSLDAYVDAPREFGARWRRMMSPKGLPIGQWLLLTRRHGGPLWFVSFCSPYLKLLSRAVKDTILGKGQRASI